MRSNYLVRISGICADIATKLMVDAPREEKASGQLRIVSRGGENSQAFRANSAPSWQPRTVRDNAQQAWTGDEDTHADFDGADMEESVSEETTDVFRFAAFVKDLDSLRRRMLGVSFCDHVWDISREIADGTENSDQLGSEQTSDSEQAMRSVRDAITSAVLLLPHHGADTRRAR